MSERGAAERRKARALPGTEFRGVSCRPGGKFGAKILDSKGKSQIWLGTFDTAEDAARAVDAAAVRMQGAAARTNFKQPDGGVSSLLHVHPEPSGSHDGRTKFRGMCPQSSGKFGARISKGEAETWLGTFDTEEEAARAYDAAAVRVCGRRARTNFEQPAAVDHEAALSSLGLGGFDSHADLSVDLPPAEWQQVDDLLKGSMDSTNDIAKMIKAAAILRHISLAGHEHGGRAEPDRTSKLSQRTDDPDDEIPAS